MIIRNGSPLLKRGTILDKEILDYLRDNGFEYWNLLLKDHVDGIISGFEIEIEGNAENNIVKIESGFLKNKGKLYKLREPVILEIPLNDGDFYVKIKFYPEEKDNKYLYNTYEIVIDLEEIKEDEIELLRIQRREGAEVRNFSKFIGQDKEYNQVNILNQERSTKTGKTLPISLMKLFAKEMMTKKELSNYDLVFCSNILNENMERTVLDLYLNEKLGVESDSYTNREIYLALDEILDNAESKMWRSNNRKRVKGMMTLE